MPFYHKLGNIPNKRHTQFRKTNGDLYSEELFSTEGFSSIYSNIYHTHAPTLVKDIGKSFSVAPQYVIENNLRHRSFLSFNSPSHKDYVKSRTIYMGNSDLMIGMAAPTESMKDSFFKNADSDEMLFVHKGKGKLKTIYGNLDFSYGDYIIIPRGTIYQLEFEDSENKLFFVESATPIKTPRRYRNEHGQLLEHSPYCERDIRVPQDLETHDELGDFKVLIKKGNEIFPYIMGSHPFDAIGWDGFVYPWIFNIENFEPITGRIHQPPPVHQTFEAHNFVVCSFVPRLYDYHPNSIPAPYNHSNVDSDEILYYVDGDFMSRKHVEQGMISLHPKGIPHGPHPGTVEKSIGQKGTEELAVMIDPFYPLKITQAALDIEDQNYWNSWVE